MGITLQTFVTCFCTDFLYTPTTTTTKTLFCGSALIVNTTTHVCTYILCMLHRVPQCCIYCKYRSFYAVFVFFQIFFCVFFAPVCLFFSTPTKMPKQRVELNFQLNSMRFFFSLFFIYLDFFALFRPSVVCFNFISLYVCRYLHKCNIRYLLIIEVRGMNIYSPFSSI